MKDLIQNDSFATQGRKKCTVEQEIVLRIIDPKLPLSLYPYSVSFVPLLKIPSRPDEILIFILLHALRHGPEQTHGQCDGVRWIAQ